MIAAWYEDPLTALAVIALAVIALVVHASLRGLRRYRLDLHIYHHHREDDDDDDS